MGDLAAAIRRFDQVLVAEAAAGELRFVDEEPARSSSTTLKRILPPRLNLTVTPVPTARSPSKLARLELVVPLRPACRVLPQRPDGLRWSIGAVRVERFEHVAEAIRAHHDFTRRSRRASASLLAGPVQGERAAPPDGSAAARPALATCFWEGPISTQAPVDARLRRAQLQLPRGVGDVLAGADQPAGGIAREGSRALSARPLHVAQLVLGRRSHRRALRRGDRSAARVGQPVRTRREARRSKAVLAGHRSRRAAARRRGGPRAEHALRRARRRRRRSSSPTGCTSPTVGYGLTGGTDLPRAVLVLEDGTHLRGEEACAAVNDANRDITVQTIPEAVWETARATPGCDAETNPAYDPIRWERFFNVNYASLAVITDCTEAGREARLGDGRRVRGRLLLEPRQRLHLRPPQPRTSVRWWCSRAGSRSSRRR